ncbi:MAG: DUF433 domain-containing protein [Symploca sp. SIO1B1]|nr:DUF433 domain-containing protein [Symploca sp. SIO1C2]NES01190.1 DUF433 domain-containing protein [Symploca sp. SIO1B1]
MTLTGTEYRHIVHDERNVAFIAGSTMKVVEIVMAQMAYSWTPEEIHINHRYLSMSQIHAALAYYWDNKQELDADIQRQEGYVKRLEEEAGESPFVTRLKAQGILS